MSSSDLLNFSAIGMTIFLIIGLFFALNFYESVKEMRKRIERVMQYEKYAGLQQGGGASFNKGQNEFLQLIKSIEISLADTIRGFTKGTAERYRLRFEQAGWNPSSAPFLMFVVNTGLVLLGIITYTILVFTVPALFSQTLIVKALAFVIVLIVALRAFEYAMDFIIHRRYGRIKKGISFSIDLLSICTRSGFGLERAFEKIAEEISIYNKDLCKEFAQTSIELNINPDRQAALRNLARRVDIPIMNVLVGGLVQAEEQGVPISQTLRMLSLEFSKQKMLEVEAKAARLPALLTLPLVLCFLPAMMIVLLGPAFSSISRSPMFS